VGQGGDLVSFDFTITPSTPPDCVVNYIITATSGGVSRNITVPAGQVDGSTPVNVDGFNVCGANHSFTVAPVTSDGQTGTSSVSVDINEGNYMLRVFYYTVQTPGSTLPNLQIVTVDTEGLGNS
jgi:hypothetical protein